MNIKILPMKKIKLKQLIQFKILRVVQLKKAKEFAFN